MLIRTKLLISHLIKLVSVSLVCLGIVAALVFSSHDRQQIQSSYEQVRNINLVVAEANRMSEQIAELFILEGRVADIVEARDALLARLDRQAELVLLDEQLRGEPGSDLVALEKVDEMRRLVAEIDDSRKVLQAYLAAGERDAAALVYKNDFENRLDRTLGDLLERAMIHERGDVEIALASSERLARQSIIMTISLVVIVATLGLANIFLFNRMIMTPIGALQSGADAVGRGDLGHVVSVHSKDELGHLATRFNAMTRELKTQRDALLSAKATLSDQVATRTRDLLARTNELEETNAKLRHVNTSRANFFADISHELRTPLTILRGQAEVTLRDSDANQADLREALEGCVRKADHMGRLVDDLLFLARSEAGSIMVARDNVVLQDVIGDVLLDGRGLRERAEVAIRPDQPNEPLVVIGDGDRLHQAVLILLDNAVKFAPAGSQIDLELATKAGRAVIRVRDTGPGLTDAELGSAFTRFYRGKTSRQRSGRGLGLGLSIAKWIIDQHDGDIRIARAPKGGAEVEISLPLARSAA